MTERSKKEHVFFINDDLPRGPTPHRDAIVISMDIGGTVVRQVLMDTGISVNVLYVDTFRKLGLKKEMLRPINTPLSGFVMDSVQAKGAVTLLVEVGKYPQLMKLDLDFVVVNLNCTHNIVMGRPVLEDLGVVISLEHLTMKF